MEWNTNSMGPKLKSFGHCIKHVDLDPRLKYLPRRPRENIAFKISFRWKLPTIELDWSRFGETLWLCSREKSYVQVCSAVECLRCANMSESGAALCHTSCIFVWSLSGRQSTFLLKGRPLDESGHSGPCHKKNKIEEKLRVQLKFSKINIMRAITVKLGKQITQNRNCVQKSWPFSLKWRERWRWTVYISMKYYDNMCWKHCKLCH